MSRPKFTEEQKEKIREERKAGASQMALAVKYGTSLSTICRVLDDEYAESVRKYQNARYHRQREEYLRMKKELEEIHGKRDEDTPADR